uniref:Uncharacterized protein n=1 Tax=Coccidioides posadasii RMSCC 3488 TaxID=454284 RepID=A0A0J6FFI3_COCPO|nr:hypothetical protein CPAG_04408 [Coccidioides posadasii RMSCC 3488]
MVMFQGKEQLIASRFWAVLPPATGQSAAANRAARGQFSDTRSIDYTSTYRVTGDSIHSSQTRKSQKSIQTPYFTTESSIRYCIPATLTESSSLCDSVVKGIAALIHTVIAGVFPESPCLLAAASSSPNWEAPWFLLADG